jgi:hypothetical protein
MSKFKRAKARKPFAKTAQVKQFVTEHVDHWEASGYTHEDIHERATAMMEHAVSGEDMVDGSPVYARALGGLLKAEGCFIEGHRTSTKGVKESPFA